ncbi:hypothetical protein ATCC90586_005041 [Pythium insidiosum]|nr:hypothetical protein ATCC90586_005041 [Pythium insidiosum]
MPHGNKHSPAERQRVLQAFDDGGDWMQVALNNGFSQSSAYKLLHTRQLEDKTRGGHRHSLVKVTVPMLTALEQYIEEDCTITLEQMRVRLMEDVNVALSTSTVSRYTVGMTYTMKELRREMSPMNSPDNKQARHDFVVKLKEHRAAGSMIVYLDETNYNVYISRNRGRARTAERAVVKFTPSPGQNLQIQCAVSNCMGIVARNYVFGSINMDRNAAFVVDTFAAALCWADSSEEYCNKPIVIVLDNAGCHERAEDLVLESPMCNPIEGCFSKLKSKVKEFMTDHRHLLLRQNTTQTLESRKRAMLVQAAEHAMPSITANLVVNQELHSAVWWEKALNYEDMLLGA